MLKATPIFQMEELKNYEPQLFRDEVWKLENIRNGGFDPLYQVHGNEIPGEDCRMKNRQCLSLKLEYYEIFWTA